MESNLIFRNVSLTINGSVLVDNINFDFKPGDKVSFVGKNGSGKTTLLNRIAGSLIPTSGVIQNSNRFINLINTRSAMFRGIKCKDYFDMIHFFYNINGQYDIHDLYQFTELQNCLQKPISHLSKGMIARLRSAPILYIDSFDGMVIDEWIGSADVGFIHKIINFCKSKLINKYLFLSSHNKEINKIFKTKEIEIQNGKFI